MTSLKPITLILIFTCICSMAFAQQKVGINTENPATELDVKSTTTEDGADINISNADNSHYLRLFSGKTTTLNSNPALYWNQTDSLVLGTFGSSFKELARLNSDGDLLMKEGGIAMGIDSTDGFFEIMIEQTSIIDTDDQVSTGSSGFQANLSAGNAVGQTFTVGLDGILTFIKIPNVVKSTTAPSYIRLSLYEDGPTGPLVM
ncbi:MAG: hypothetical protein AAGK97_03910, partial [Bacteroidota bacterium]